MDRRGFPRLRRTLHAASSGPRFEPGRRRPGRTPTNGCSCREARSSREGASQMRDSSGNGLSSARLRPALLPCLPAPGNPEEPEADDGSVGQPGSGIQREIRDASRVKRKNDMCPSTRSRSHRSIRGGRLGSGTRASRGRSVAVVRATFFLVLSIPLVSAGCRFTPIREIRGARHYAEGTRALGASDPARAVAELELAAELVPEASEIQNHLGLAYWSEGRPENARAAFERALELDCGNEAARLNLDNLQRSASLTTRARLGE